jgi:hypothetical protein
MKNQRPTTRPRVSLLLWLCLALWPAATAAGQGWFAYTDQFRVVVLEFKGANLAILNVINLGDTAVVVEPSSVLVIKANGQAVAGQVFASKDPGGATVYQASMLVKPRSAAGTDLLGAYDLHGDAVKAYMLLAGRYLELAGLRKDQFESLFSRLGELDLTEPDVGRMFRSLAIPDYGVFIPYEEADSVRGLHEKCFTDEGVNPPKFLRRPMPALTPAALAAGYKATVTVTIRLDKAGNILGATFTPEPEYGMAERIRETILNSWQFLPATYNGEMVATELKAVLQIGDTGGTGKTEKH